MSEYEEYVKGQVFLGMQFDGMDDIYKVLKNACSDCGLYPIRVDELHGSNTIIDEIRELIEQSEFIILDVTHNNANVYYELGYADGVGNTGADMMLVAKEGAIIPFDIRHRRVLFYNDAFDLQEKLKVALPKFIESGRK